MIPLPALPALVEEEEEEEAAEPTQAYLQFSDIYMYLRVWRSSDSSTSDSNILTNVLSSGVSL